MSSFRDIIDRIGTNVLARLLGVGDSHVRTMRARDSIPPEYWGAIVENAPANCGDQVTYEALRRIRAERFAKATRRAGRTSDRRAA